MKRNILKIMTLCTVAVLALASCKKDNQPQNNTPEKGFLATVEANQGNGSRTHLVGSEVQWNADDQIVVRNANGTSATFQLSDGENTTEGTFLSSQSGDEFFQPTYTAVYPATGNTVTGEGAATFTLPATQSYVANSFANGAMPMMAVSDEQTLEFKNALGGICFPMVGDGLTVTRLVLTSNNAADHLSGVFSADYNNGQPTLSYTSGGANSITLDCGAGVALDATTATDFIIMVPAGSLANGFTVTVYDEETQLDEKTTTANPSITRSVISKPNSSLEIICPCSFGPAGFTVGMDGDTPRRVFFAPANLQYQASTGTWHFAENQWDYIGDAAGNNTAEADRPTQAAWIDLFGWGTSGWNNGNYFYQPYSSSNSTYSPYTESNGYGYGPTDGSLYTYSLTGAYANADWGVYNAIYNPKTNTTDPAGTWRTLTHNEWAYIISTRTTCSGVRYAKATVNNVPGVIIVPDNWDVNTYALNGTNTAGAAYTVNTISSADWTNIFEPAGCAFLPAAGSRNGSSVNDVGTRGSYWSTTYSITRRAYSLGFSSSDVGPSYNHNRYYGKSVRLVRSAE